jgi:hypothetical protein
MVSVLLQRSQNTHEPITITLKDKGHGLGTFANISDSFMVRGENV